MVSCGDEHGRTLNATERAAYRERETCTGLSASEPRIDYGETAPCPESGNPCCLVDYLPAGASAVYYPRTSLIVTSHAHETDARCPDSLGFEFTRHLMCKSGNLNDACHTETLNDDPRWTCS